ncbi:MAG: MBL fold metallo-hydrolase [Woeseiaceae bacterium]
MRCFAVVVTFLISFCSLGLVSAQQAIGSTKMPDPSAEFDWFKIGDNLYQFRYQHHYTLFATTSKGVVAFDPLSNEAAEHYVDAIKAVAPGQPLIAIIYTHWHVDHSSGAKILKREFGDTIGDTIPIIAHERTLRRLRRWNDSDILLPTNTVSDKGTTLRYGNLEIELNYIGYGHTNTMLVARFPRQKLVFAVDFANNDAVGWTDLPGWYLNELIAMQGRLLGLDFDIVAFGHGMPGDKTTIKRQIGYYKNLTTLATLALKQGLSEDEAVTTIETKLTQYKQWRFYDMWFLMNIRGAYRWAQEK